MVAVLEESQDAIAELTRRFASCGNHLTPAQVGLSDPVFSCDLTQVCGELQRLTETRAPVDKRRIWKNIFDLVAAAVQVRCVQLKQQVPLTSDELLPLLVLAVVNAQLVSLPAELMYLENFGSLNTRLAAAASTSILSGETMSSSSAGSDMDSSTASSSAVVDEYSYHLVTMQAVLQYLLQGDLFSSEGGSSGSDLQAGGTASTSARRVSNSSLRSIATGGAVVANNTVASAMLKARRSTEELAAAGRTQPAVPSSAAVAAAAAAAKGSGGSSGSDGAGGAAPLLANGGGKLGSPSASHRRSLEAEQPSPSLMRREVNLPPVKATAPPSEDDIGPLLRRLRGF